MYMYMYSLLPSHLLMIFLHVHRSAASWRGRPTAGAGPGCAMADATRWQDHALAAWSGVAAGGLYALSPLTWQYSVTAEARPHFRATRLGQEAHLKMHGGLPLMTIYRVEITLK